ncbi:MAG: insecticidal delta-endotoxin Cry8Ea1 family protein [Saprospiraceae bacterium]
MENTNVNNELVKNSNFVMEDMDWGALAQKFADGLAGIIGGEIGSLLFETIFPDNTFDWDKLASIVSAIIQEKLDEQTLTTTADKMSGVINFMNTEYKNLKTSDPNDLKGLSSSLKPYDHDLYVNVISVFMSKQLAEKSIANFMMAANTHLAVIQEEALVDPDHPKNPLKSGFAQTIKDLVKEYSTHAKETAQKVIATRLTKISDLDSWCSSGMYQGFCAERTYFYKDAVTGQQYNFNGNHTSYQDIEASLNNYISSVKNQISNDMDKNLIQVANTWMKLLDNPVPSQT